MSTLSDALNVLAHDIDCEDGVATTVLIQAAERLSELESEVGRLRELLWTPENVDFAAGVIREAGHQVERWGNSHDAGKDPQDWFWLVGYLAGKALRAHADGNTEKALHHTISTAAVCANWHRHISGSEITFRPGISEEKQQLVSGGE